MFQVEIDSYFKIKDNFHLFFFFFFFFFEKYTLQNVTFSNSLFHNNLISFNLKIKEMFFKPFCLISGFN